MNSPVISSPVWKAPQIPLWSRGLLETSFFFPVCFHFLLCNLRNESEKRFETLKKLLNGRKIENETQIKTKRHRKTGTDSEADRKTNKKNCKYTLRSVFAGLYTP